MKNTLNSFFTVNRISEINSLKYAVLLSLALPLSTQAAPPKAPEVGMREIDRYASLDCSQIREEINAVDQWKKYSSERNIYLKQQTNSMKNLDTFGSALFGVLGALDPSSKELLNESAKDSELATKASQASQQQAEIIEAGIKKRNDALNQLYLIRKCSEDTSVGAIKKAINPNVQLALATISRLKMEDPTNPMIPKLYFNVAMTSYGDGTNETRRMLIDLIQKYPSSPSVKDAQYWLGTLPEK